MGWGGRERGKEGSGLGTCFQIFPTQPRFYFLIMYFCLHHGQLVVHHPQAECQPPWNLFLHYSLHCSHIRLCCSSSQEGFPMVLWDPNFLCFTKHAICTLHILLTQQIILKMKLFLSWFSSIPNHPFVLHIYICIYIYLTYIYICLTYIYTYIYTFFF